jgi:YbbR domain-containing protein
MKMNKRKFFSIKNIKSIFVENFWTKALALVFTLALWFTVNASRNIEIVKKIPLNFITSPAYVVANKNLDEVKSVDVKLTGPRAFLREVLERDYIIDIDLRNKKPGYVRYKLYKDLIKLPIGVKVNSIHPDEVTPKLEAIKLKKVSVEASVVGELPDGYKLNKKIVIEPSRVEVSGPSRFISKLKEVYIEAINLDNIKEGVTKEVSIDMERYKGKIKDISSDKFSVYLDVGPIITEKKFHGVKIKAFSPNRFKINPEKVTVVVKGPKKVIENLDLKDIKASIDLTYNKPGTYKEKIKVLLPQDVEFISTIPNKVDVWIMSK